MPVVGAVSAGGGRVRLRLRHAGRRKPGKFTFRFWVNDTTPPRDPRRSPSSGRTIRLAVTDKGSGVDPASIVVKVDGTRADLHVRARHPHDPQRRARQARASPLTASDYQEAKNMENVGPILPNTRTFSKTVVVR